MVDTDANSPPVPELIPDTYPYPVAPRGCGPPSLLVACGDLPPRPFSTPPRISSCGGSATPSKTCVVLCLIWPIIALLTLFNSSLQAPSIKKKFHVHSDSALRLSLLRLVIASVVVFIFVRRFSFGLYNSRRVSELCLLSSTASFFFSAYDYILFGLPSPFLHSWFFWIINVVRRRSARDAIVTVPLLYVPPYDVLCLMCLTSCIYRQECSTVTKDDEPLHCLQRIQVSTTEVVDDFSLVDVVQHRQPRTSPSFRFRSS